MPRVIIAPSALNPALRNVQQFDGDVEAFVRSRHPSVCRWHFEFDGTDYYAVGVPADPASATFFGLKGWTAIFAQIAASVVLSFASGKLLSKPKSPTGTSKSLDSASPTYSIGDQQNQARLGAVIPVVYGEVVMMPDYAAQPVVEFTDGENQYLRAIYCVGHGDVDVTNMYVGETEVGALEDKGAVAWRVFKPADHGSRFGVIEAATGVPENVFTNSEVGDQILEGPKPGAPAPADWHWTLQGPYASVPSGFGAAHNRDYFLNMSRPSMMGIRDVYNSPTGNYYIATATDGAGNAADPDQIVPATPTSTEITVGPFNMCKPSQQGTEAALDFVFPGGLFWQNPSTGNLELTSVVVRVTFYPIDATGVSTGAPIVFHRTFRSSSVQVHRYTERFTLPLGRYQCAVTRETARPSSMNTSDAINWTGLKFKLSAPTHPVYGDVTLVAASIKATNAVSGQASGKVRLRCRRSLPVIDGVNNKYTHNPVDVMVDILTAKYGGRRPMTDEELDMDEMRRSRRKWDAHNGFNAVFDRMTTVWEAMTMAVSPVAAVPLPQGNRISMAHDSVKDFRAALFTDENIVAGSLQINYEFDKIGDPTSTKVEYRTGEWFDTAFVQVPPDRDDFDSVNLFGCTSHDVAEQHAILTNNRRRLRRKTITFETELDGLLVMHGQRIGVAHSTPRWGHSAQVVERRGNELALSVAVDWSIPNLTMLIRDTEGRPHQIRGITQGKTPKHAVLPSDPAFTIPTIDGGYEGAIVAFGELNREVTDWVVLAMEPSGENRIKISATEYRPDVYVNAMPHQLIDTTVNP